MTIPANLTFSVRLRCLGMTANHAGAFGGGRKEKAAAAAGSQKKSKKTRAGGQGTASACKTAPGVRGGMQIWVPDKQRLILAGKQLEGRRLPL